MIREQLIQETGRKILRPLGFIQLAFLSALVASVFILIWGTWAIAWKVGLTGIVGILVVKVLYNVAKEAIVEGVDSYIDDAVKGLNPNIPKTSKFQEQLERMAKERGQK